METNTTNGSLAYSLDYYTEGVENASNSTNFGYDWIESWANFSTYPSGYSQLRIVLTSFCVTIIMILIVVGNMLVCIAIATEKTLKTIQNWFIASLAVSDFLLGLVIMPFSLANELMGYWIFGTIWCDIHSALDVLLCTASINNLCLISLDRYWSVTQAVEYLKKRTSSRAMFMICFVWLLSALISLPPLVGWKKQSKTSEYPTCALSDDIGYVLYSAFGSFYIPAVVMVFVYIRIFIAARSRARRHVKKKSHMPEFTNDPVKDKSTTTTTCTSFSNPSPPEKGGVVKEEEEAGQRNGSRPPTYVFDESGAVPPRPTPQIVIDTPPESPTPRRYEAEDDDDDDEDYDDEEESRGGLKGGVKGGVYHLNCESLKPEEATPRTGLLASQHKGGRSPFGSTLSLAEMERAEMDSKQGGMVVCPGPRHVPSDAERHKRKVAKARERRATLILGLIMAAFILAWLPFFILYVLEALCLTCYIGETGFAVAFWLGYCNSALNPIIYTIFNRDFRRAFRKILFK